MEPNNRTTYTVTEFIITGLDDVPHPKLVGAAILFILFLILIGCITNICIVAFNKPLHTPMYLFICTLAMVDIVYTSGSTMEPFTIALMAYDRLIAISHPLRYQTILTKTSIVYEVMKMSSSKDRGKTFNTCVSHIIVVACFFIPKVLLILITRRSEGA
ncbi:olfactory receptor 480-like [Coregonus clupeaformis]|uniref:olfactory receptor 480-like n=1 Tax=Coregonus clupeaformis TaxID=59861 RepID=UPI001E1C90D3|nr:olfactory receptor 480-like [Coregonus clupeaformis]